MRNLKLFSIVAALVALVALAVWAVPATTQQNPPKVVGYQLSVSTTPTDTTNRVSPETGYVITKVTIVNKHASQTVAFAINKDGAGTLGVATNGTDFTLAAGESITFDCLANLITLDGSGAATTTQVLTYQHLR